MTSSTMIFESVAPVIPETLESALHVPSQDAMRKSSNQRFFRKWFQHRHEKESLLSSPRKALSVLRRKKTSVATTPQDAVSSKSTNSIHPQAYLNQLLQSRGYSTQTYSTLETAYSNRTPTRLQLASYGPHLVDLVRTQQHEAVQAIFQAGISPNPCTKQGESLVHMMARRGDATLLKVVQQAGGRLDQADGLGRTPLHDAFWASGAPSYETVELILNFDIQLLYMADCRDALPLSCARPEHWADWIAFFESRKEHFWPVRDETPPDDETPLVAELPPNARPIRDPINALTPELATMVVTGTMEPEEARMLRHENLETVEDDDDDVQRTTLYHMQALTERSFDEADMDDILATLTNLHPSEATTTELHEIVATPSSQGQNPTALLHQSQSLMDDLYSSSDEDDEDDSSVSSNDSSLLDGEDMDDLLAGLAAVGARKTCPKAATSLKAPTKRPEVVIPSLEQSDGDDDDEEDDSSCYEDSSSCGSSEDFMANLPILSQ